MGFNEGEVCQVMSGPGVAPEVCLDFTSGRLLDPAEEPILDVIAETGLAASTELRVELPGRTVGRYVCRVTDCRVSCRIVGSKNSVDGTITIHVDEGIGESAFERCVRHSAFDEE